MMRAFIAVLVLSGCFQKPFRFSAPFTKEDPNKETARALVACGKAFSPVLGRRDDAVVTLWELSDIPANDPDRNGPEDIARRYRLVSTRREGWLDVDVRVELGLDRGGMSQQTDPNTHQVLGDCTEEKFPGVDVFRCAAVEPRYGAACDKNRNCIGVLEPMTNIPAYEVAARDKLAECLRDTLVLVPAAP